MAASGTSNTSDLVPKEDLDALRQLDSQLVAVNKTLSESLIKSQQFAAELSKASIPFKDLAKVMDEFEKTQKQVNVAQQEQQRIQRDTERIQEKIKTAYSAENMELEHLRQIMRDISTVRRNIIKEQNSQSGSTEQLRAKVNLLNNSIDRMSKEMRESPLGKQMVADAQRLTKEVKELEGATGRFQRNVGNYPNSLGGFFKELKSSFSGGSGSLTGAITAAGGAIGLVAGAVGSLVNIAIEGIGKIISSGKEFVSTGIEMAAKAEGVSRAFSQLDSPDLLNNLRKQTRGTISDFNLMAAAVKADKYKIPINEVGNLLEFAGRRAIDMGKNVDDFQKRIIEGIGKQSKVTLDDLGMSSAEIANRVKESGSFAKGVIDMVNEELKKQGELPLTAADKAQQAAVKWENAQLKIGDGLLFVSNAYNAVSSSVADFISDSIEKYMPSALKYVEDLINGIIDIYNNFLPIRAAVQASYNAWFYFFEVVKLGVKDSLVYLMGFVKVAGSALKLNFKEAAESYKEFSSKITNNRVDFMKNIVDRVHEGTEAIKKKLSHIDITTKIKVKPIVTGGGDDDADVDEKAKKLAEERAKAEAKAAEEIAQTRIQQEADTHKKILENNKKSYEERMQAVDEYENKMGEKLVQARDSQMQKLRESYKDLSDVEFRKQAANQIEAIEVKLQAELTKLNDEGGKLREQIFKNYVEQQLTEYEDSFEQKNSMLEGNIQEELAKYAQMYAEGYIGRKEYESLKTQAVLDGAKARFDLEVASLRNMLDVAGITAEQKKEIEKQLVDAELKYNKEIIKADEDTAKTRLDIEKQLADKRKELMKAVGEFISTMFEAETERNIAKLEKESEANDEWREKEMERIERQEEQGVISKEQADAQKAMIDDQAQQREKEIEAQKKEILQRQAKYEKLAAIAQIGIDTGRAVMKNTALLGLVAATPINALTIALGAVQAATVLAKPLPQYEKGTDYHPGGFAIVGERRKELIKMPTGEMYVTPDTPTLTYLPKGAEVLPDFNKVLANASLQQGFTEPQRQILISENVQQLERMDKQTKVLSEISLNQKKIFKVTKLGNRKNHSLDGRA